MQCLKEICRGGWSHRAGGEEDFFISHLNLLSVRSWMRCVTSHPSIACSPSSLSLSPFSAEAVSRVGVAGCCGKRGPHLPGIWAGMERKLLWGDARGWEEGREQRGRGARHVVCCLLAYNGLKMSKILKIGTWQFPLKCKTSLPVSSAGPCSLSPASLGFFGVLLRGGVKAAAAAGVGRLPPGAAPVQKWPLGNGNAANPPPGAGGKEEFVKFAFGC